MHRSAASTMETTIRLTGVDLLAEMRVLAHPASIDPASRQWRLKTAVTIENMPILTWNEGGNPS